MNNTNSLIPGIIQEPYNSELMAKLVDVEREMQEQAGLNAEGFKCLYNRVSNLDRKERRKIVRRAMSTLPNGKSVLVTFFDDGQSYAEDFMLNVNGVASPFKIRTQEAGRELFGIQFGTSGHVIVGELRKVKPSYLYELFIKHGISFYEKLSPTQIGKILFESLAHSIISADRVVSFSESGGWNGQEFVTSENFYFAKCPEFSNAPVMKKSWEEGTINAEIVKKYSQSLLVIQEYPHRVLVAMYPFIGILSSLFEDGGIPNKVVLNIIPCGRVRVCEICNRFQIFCRNTLLPINLSGSLKDQKKILCSKRDEVVLLDARDCGPTTNYQKNKQESNLARILEAYLGYSEIQDKIPPVGMVTISNILYPKENVFNILLSGDQELLELEDHVMGIIFSEFAKFVESNKALVVRSIEQNRDPALKSVIRFVIIEQLLKAFWKSQGYDFWRILGAEVKNKQYEALFSECCFDIEDVITRFVVAMRRDANLYVFHKKSHEKLDICDIAYNDEWIWIPTRVVSEVCERNGLKKYVKLLLFKCKQEGLLKTDADGMSRKLTSGQISHEYYQFKKSVFECKGKAELVKLGKEK